MSEPALQANENTTASNRLEALTDGVFAIVLTILVFELKVPEAAGANAAEGIWQAFASLAPRFVIYFVSFAIIGVYWVAHHSQFQYIRRANQTLIWINLLFLMFVSLIPFAAGFVGTYAGQQLPVVIYGLNLLLVASMHFATWRFATSGRRLVESDMPEWAVRYGARLSLIPPVCYAAAIALSFVSPALSVAVFALVPIPYALGWIYRWLQPR